MDDLNSQDLSKYLLPCSKGDVESFRCLFDYTYNKIFNYVISRTNSRDDALDLTQEIFIDLWRSMPKFKYKSNGKFYGFLFLIARRKLIKYYRSYKVNIELSDKNVSANYEMPFEDYQHLSEKIGKLRFKYQEILRLRYWSELSFNEIANIMKISENYAKVLHHRAINKMKGFLE